MTSSRLTTGRYFWSITAFALAFVAVVSLFGPLGGARWDRPGLLFALVVGSAAICVTAATIVVALADRRRIAELGLLGTALTVASVMPLAHGLTTPGVLYESNAAFRTTAFLALPTAMLVAAPLLRPRSAFGRWAARSWRDWALLSLLGSFVVASILVFYPDAVSVPGPRHPVTIALSVVLAALTASLSLRQLKLYEIGRRSANLVASLALLAVTSLAFVPLAGDELSMASWWLHAVGAIGVLGACFGIAIAARVDRSTIDVLAPVLSRDPLVAFELGLSPVVHQFVASLDDQDPDCRDHVLRTAEMAIRIGERFKLSPRQLRDLGLAAMLHDVGKLGVPAEILAKPGRLSEEEFEAVKQHSVLGEQMLLAEATLASVAPIVRSHHERLDGGGYPDGLVGNDIPLAARIIAVCDALDAMTHDRDYRPAMSVGLALSVLREHSGGQWDPAVIDQVMAVMASMPVPGGLDAVGRSEYFVPRSAAPATVTLPTGAPDVADEGAATLDDAALDDAAFDDAKFDMAELMAKVDVEI